MLNNYMAILADRMYSVGMKTISLDVRERILKAYDGGKGVTREEVAKWFSVSLGMVKKLLQQRKHTGDIAPLHHRAGRKPTILPHHRQQFRDLIKAQVDITLSELRTATRLTCTLPAIHYVLKDMGLTYKKRHFAPASKIVRTSKKPVRSGRRKVRRGT